MPEESGKRLNRLMTIIGYMLHKYKDPANAKAVILLDTDHLSGPSGGTGKGIIVKAIGQVRKLNREDGKSISTSNRFNLANVDEYTDIIVIDDVPKGFNFEDIFSMVTDGVTIEKKYQNKFILPFDRSPKIMLSSNYLIAGNTSSHRRRRVEFQVTNYFNAGFTPEDKYGHRLFDEWDNEQWLLFYNLMIGCQQKYLKNGIVQSDPEVLWYPRLQADTCQEFADFAEEHFTLDHKHDKKEMLEAFKAEYPDFKSMKQRTFTSWIKQYAGIRGYKLIESHSGHQRYFELKSKGAHKTIADMDKSNQN
jgi:hypothetical protein